MGDMTVDSGELRESSILVVDDEATNLRMLEKILARAGYENVRTESDSREVMGLFRELRPDLLLLDLRMPHLDGFDVLAFLAEEVPAHTYHPVLVLTGDLAPEVRERALSAGARDFITKPFDVTEVLLRIRNLLETRALHVELQHQNESLESRVRERTRELAQAQIEILQRLALAAEYRDDITGHHAERVGLLSALIAEQLGVPGEEVKLLRRAATLHDVGKIGVPDAILMKPAPLNAKEFELMKNHTEIGARILSGSRFPLLRMAQEIAWSHHERWDGEGYSRGRAGEEIPLVGRIVAVADVFDSLTHERPYKRAFEFEEAIEIIEGGSGAHFDPRVIEAFQRLIASGAVQRLEAMVQESLKGKMQPKGFPSPLADVPLDPGDELPSSPPIEVEDPSTKM